MDGSGNDSDGQERGLSPPARADPAPLHKNDSHHKRFPMRFFQYIFPQMNASLAISE